MLDRLLNIEEVARIIGHSKRHVMRLEKEGRFPKRANTGARTVRFSESDVDRWLEQTRSGGSGA